MKKYEELLDLFSAQKRYSIREKPSGYVYLKYDKQHGKKVDANIAQNLIFYQRVVIENENMECIEGTGVELLLPLICNYEKFKMIQEMFQMYCSFVEEFREIPISEICDRLTEYKNGVQMFWEIKDFMDEVLCMTYEDINTESCISKADLHELENIQSISYNKMISDLCKGIRLVWVLVDCEDNYLVSIGQRTYLCEEQMVGMCYTDPQFAECALEDYQVEVCSFELDEINSNNLSFIFLDEFIKEMNNKNIHSIVLLGTGGQVCLTF